MLEWLENLLARGLGVIVLSDYGKGMITAGLSEKVIALARTYKVPVLVDPKGSDWTKYDGAFGITPNLKELSDCVGREIPNDDKAVEEAGKKVREKYHLTHLFVTRSEKGITCISEKGAIHRASAARTSSTYPVPVIRSWLSPPPLWPQVFRWIPFWNWPTKPPVLRFPK